MTRITKIRLQHVRAHADYTATINPAVTVITGPNGSGKTSILEALYIALQGSSFRGSDQDIISQAASWYRIDLWHDDTVRTVKFDSERMAGRKQFTIDGKPRYRLTPDLKLPVVLFEPDHLRLLSGSPTRRREFIDRFISQIDPRYATALRRYERALRQRNALLKKTSPHQDELFAWDVSLSEYGAYIVRRRHELIQELDQALPHVYHVIAGSKDTVHVYYSEPLHDNIEQQMLRELHARSDKDKLLGFTSTGPHRHDIIFEFNQAPAATQASRGEIRSIVLALKFLEVSLTERLTGKKPLILLDDVFSELDKQRQKNLMTEFTDHQIIITSVEAIPIKSNQIIKLAY